MDKELFYYKLTTNESGYIDGFYAVDEDVPYDYYGQMADFPDIDYSFPEGWYTFDDGEFVLDQERKDEVLANRESKASEPTSMDLLEAQVLWTALMTDTLIEENE